MDLSKIIKADATFEMELLHPVSEQPIGMTIEIRSSQSDAVKAVERESSNKIMERQQKKKLVTAETGEALAEKRAAVMIKGWKITAKEPIEIDGVALGDCTKETKAAIVKIDWIYEQIVAASEAHANFT